MEALRGTTDYSIYGMNKDVGDESETYSIYECVTLRKYFKDPLVLRPGPLTYKTGGTELCH